MIEPGPFRTDFAGRSPARAAPMEVYDEVLGTSRAKFAALHGTQPGDPGRAAQAVVGVVDLDDPPLRLPLGASAVDSVRETLHRRLAEVDAVEHLGRPTDYPAAPAS